MSIPAIQVLPGRAWLLSFAAAARRQRLVLVRAATVGYLAPVAVSDMQTAAGSAPLDVGVAAAALYLLGVAFLAALLALRNPTPAAA
jgi:hypothetical protein